MTDKAKTKYVILEDTDGKATTWRVVGHVETYTAEQAIRKFLGEGTGTFAAVAVSSFHAHVAVQRPVTQLSPIRLDGQTGIPTEAPVDGVAV